MILVPAYLVEGRLTLERPDDRPGLSLLLVLAPDCVQDRNSLGERCIYHSLLRLCLDAHTAYRLGWCRALSGGVPETPRPVPLSSRPVVREYEPVLEMRRYARECEDAELATV